MQRRYQICIDQIGLEQWICVDIADISETGGLCRLYKELNLKLLHKQILLLVNSYNFWSILFEGYLLNINIIY